MLLRVLIAEDHLLTADGIRFMLERNVEAHVVACCTDGTEVLPAIQHHRPELVILDLSLPGRNGLDLIEEISTDTGTAWIVVYTGYEDDQYVTEAFRRGADAYVLKGDPPEDLVTAARTVRRGRQFVSTSIPDSLRAPVTSGPEGESGSSVYVTRFDRLTRREREVFQLIAEGGTSSDIADRLSISKRTVDKHRENVKRKMEATSIAELVSIAAKLRLIHNQNPPGLLP